MKVKLENQVISLNQGEKVKVGIGKLHTFWSELEEPVIFRGTLKPGNEDFENAITISFGLARDGFLTNKGILGLIFRLLTTLINKSKLAKEKNELVERYCM